MAAQYFNMPLVFNFIRVHETHPASLRRSTSLRLPWYAVPPSGSLNENNTVKNETAG